MLRYARMGASPQLPEVAASEICSVLIMKAAWLRIAMKRRDFLGLSTCAAAAYIRCEAPSRAGFHASELADVPEVSD